MTPSVEYGVSWRWSEYLIEDWITVPAVSLESAQASSDAINTIPDVEAVVVLRSTKRRGLLRRKGQWEIL